MALNIQNREFEGNRGNTLTVDGPQDLLANVADSYGGDSWYGDDSAQTVYHRATYGHEQFVADVEAMLESVNAGLQPTSSYLLENSIIGFTPDVPSAVMNLPECMVQMTPTQSDFAPVTVWANTTMSGGCSRSMISKRGAAVAAMVMKLQALRPTTLKVVTGLGGGQGGNQFLICPIDSRPLSIAQVSYILCHEGFTRRNYSLLTAKLGANGGWDRMFGDFKHNAYHKELARQTIGFLGGDTEHDIYVPQLFLHDRLANDPVKWIEETLAQYRTQE